MPIDTGIPYRQPVSAKATDLCRQADDIGLRISLLYIGLADWNCWNYRVFPVNWLWTTITGAKLDCGAPTEQQPDGIVKAWRSHETRVSASIAVMAGFALPMMLSFLGGCAYVLREHGMKLANWTLEPHDGKNPWLRVLLAALLGGLVGVIWTSDEPVALGGFNLSLAAIAFFVGFSVEAVFRLIQTLIEGVVSTIRAPGSTAGPASPITTSQVRRIAQESATGVSQPPSLLGVEPTIAKRREAATLRVLGSNLNQVGQLQLSLGESVITATSVTSNSFRVEARITIPENVAEGAWDVAVADGIGRTAKLERALKIEGVIPLETSTTAVGSTWNRPADSGPASSNATVQQTPGADGDARDAAPSLLPRPRDSREFGRCRDARNGCRHPRGIRARDLDK